MKREISIALGLLVLLGALAWLFYRSSGSRQRDAGAVRRAESETSPAATRASSPLARSATETTDFAAALNHALKEVDPRVRSTEFGRLLAEWFAINPEDALAYVQNMPRGAEYTEALFIVLPKLAETNPKRAVELTGEMATTREQQAVYSSLFDLIARKDIAQAQSLLSVVPKGEGRDNALRAMAVAWADQNVLEALEWAKGIDDAGERATAIEATLIVRSKRDARRTIDLAKELLTGDALDRTLTEALRHLTEEDPKSAAEIVKGLADGPMKTRATFEVVRALAGRDPQAALAWLNSMTPGQDRQLALNNVLDLWSANDPTAASNWVAAMPNGPDRDKAAARLAEDLAAADPSRALQWSESLQGSARVAALIGFSSGWARKDPAAAAKWAVSLPPNDPARPDAIKNAVSYWMLRDADAARTFVNSLPEEDGARATVPRQ